MVPVALGILEELVQLLVVLLCRQRPRNDRALRQRSERAPALGLLHVVDRRVVEQIFGIVADAGRQAVAHALGPLSHNTPHGETDSAAENTPQPDIEGIQTGTEEYVDAGEATADSIAETDELQAELDQARAEAEQYRDQAVRAHAEMENVRKRAQRDVESARKFAIEKFASELLGVRDSLELGLKAAEEHSGDYDKLKEGMDMTVRMLVSSMEKVFTKKISAILLVQASVA